MAVREARSPELCGRWRTIFFPRTRIEDVDLHMHLDGSGRISVEESTLYLLSDDGLHAETLRWQYFSVYHLLLISPRLTCELLLKYC